MPRMVIKPGFRLCALVETRPRTELLRTRSFAFLLVERCAELVASTHAAAASFVRKPGSALPGPGKISERYSAATLFFWALSNMPQTPSAPCQSPPVAPLEYSVARASKKLACSTPLRISDSHGIGCSFTP